MTKNKNFSVSINMSSKNLFYDQFDPISKNIKYFIDIFIEYFNEEENDDKILVGQMILSTSGVNLINLSFSDLDVLDSVSSSESRTNFSIINIEELSINHKLLPFEIDDCDNLFLLDIQNIIIKKEFRGLNITSNVFNILKTIFCNHLFILKPFPLQYCDNFNERNDLLLETLNKTIPLPSGIKKLISLYYHIGFRCLNINTKEPYMVMINNN